MRATLNLAVLGCMVLGCMVLGCMVVGCGGDQPAPLPGPVVLPTTSIWGDEPARAGRVDITITSKGELFVGHIQTTLAALLPALIEASGGTPTEEPRSESSEDEAFFEETESTSAVALAEVNAAYGRLLAPREPGVFEPDGTRAADVLLRFDVDVPWSVAAEVMQTCAHPDLRLLRIFAAVRGGAIGVFLPEDRCCLGDAPEGEAYTVRLGRPSKGTWPPHPQDAGALIDALRRMQPTPDTPIQLALQASPLTSWAAIVRVVDAALRARVWNFVFEGRRPAPHVSIAERMAACRKTGPVGVVIRNGPRVDQAVGRMADGGRVAGLLGFAGTSMSLEEDHEEEAIVEEEPSDARKAAADR